MMLLGNQKHQPEKMSQVIQSICIVIKRVQQLQKKKLKLTLVDKCIGIF